MAKHIRFTHPDTPYMQGDVARFDDDAKADHFIARGTAVPHHGVTADAPSEAPAHLALQPVGPVQVQGRVEAHQVEPPTTTIATVDAKPEPAKPASQRPASAKPDANQEAKP